MLLDGLIMGKRQTMAMADDKSWVSDYLPIHSLTMHYLLSAGEDPLTASSSEAAALLRQSFGSQFVVSIGGADGDTACVMDPQDALANGLDGAENQLLAERMVPSLAVDAGAALVPPGSSAQGSADAVMDGIAAYMVENAGSGGLAADPNGQMKCGALGLCDSQTVRGILQTSVDSAASEEEQQPLLISPGPMSLAVLTVFQAASMEQIYRSYALAEAEGLCSKVEATGEAAAVIQTAWLQQSGAVSDAVSRSDSQDLAIALSPITRDQIAEQLLSAEFQGRLLQP